MDQLAEKLKTVVAINVTPFASDLTVDYDLLDRNLDFLVRSGIKAVTPCGNTGEFNSLTVDECRRVISLACQRLCGKATIIAGVGQDLQTAIAAARHAQGCGADAVMVHHPPHPFLTGAGYFRYVKEIASAVQIGVIPYVRSPSIPDAALLELAQVNNVVGVKYAVNDVQRFALLVAQSPKDKPIAWICGTAEGWAPFFWAGGAAGFTSGLVNVAPKASLAMLDGLRRGDLKAVRQQWVQIQPFEQLRARDSSALNVSVVKEAMAQLGLGTRTVRPPISELSEADRAQVQRILSRWKEAA